jgi:5-methylcytosine-specific restriction protein A
MNNREFRTTESYEAERVTRDMLPGYIRRLGFTDVRDVRRSHGRTESQTIHATMPNGEPLAMRVRLCWRRTSKKWQPDTYSAVQLLQTIENDDWDGSLTAKVEREKSDGTTHFLFVQRDGNDIIYAALVPLSELVTIWRAQRDIYQTLLKENKLGRKKKNPAMNGSSPTLWLRDHQAPTVAAALWDHPGVQDLTRLDIVTTISNQSTDLDDTFDDMPGVDYSLLGSDGAPVIKSVRSGVKRDQRVRMAVLHRAKGKCEREGCEATRDYNGFFDVHHILRADKSDRVWNCVVLCPNCHREAHAAPDRDRINESLLVFAMRFKNPT